MSRTNYLLNKHETARLTDAEFAELRVVFQQLDRIYRKPRDLDVSMGSVLFLLQELSAKFFVYGIVVGVVLAAVFAAVVRFLL